MSLCSHGDVPLKGEIASSGIRAPKRVHARKVIRSVGTKGELVVGLGGGDS